MGFPLSRFQQLAELCRKEKYTVEEFGKYRLTAIVLHKPRSSAFKRVMQENFEHLHTATGKDFAFITFLNPPESWAEEHKSWMETRESLVTDSGNYSSEAFLEALCTRLSIQALPAIVITDNLNSSRYAVLQTGSKAVVRQMEQIGAFASAQAHRFPINARAFTDFLGSLGEYDMLETRDSEYLSTNIVDIMAAFSMDGSGASSIGDEEIDKMAAAFQKKSARQHIKDAISRNKSRYEALRKEPLTGSEEIDTARDVYSSYLALVLRQETAVRRAHSRGDMSGTARSQSSDVVAIASKSETFSFKTYFTKKSRVFYKTFLVMKKYFNGDIRSEFADPEEEFDYSPACVDLCKIVEEELNASIVQLIRQYKGIPMPEFYCEHCAERRKVVVANNLINLLDKKTKTLKQIPIGNIICMIEALRNQDFLAPFNTDQFLEAVGSFKEYRNDTPHPVILDRRDFEEMNRLFDDLFNGWIIRLYNVKQTLQGRETIKDPAIQDNARMC